MPISRSQKDSKSGKGNYEREYAGIIERQYIVEGTLYAIAGIVAKKADTTIIYRTIRNT